VPKAKQMQPPPYRDIDPPAPPGAKFEDIVVDHRRFLVTLVIIITAVLAFFIPKIQMDPGLKSGLDPTSPEYLEYQKFVETFGDEEFVLVAIKSAQGARDPSQLATVDTITRNLEEDDKIEEVISLSNLRVFQEKEGRFGTFPVLQKRNGDLTLPEGSSLEAIRRALPIVDLLLSSDLKTVGILVRVRDQWKFDPEVTQHVVAKIERLGNKADRPGSELRIIGVPIIRLAILRYNLQTAAIFGALCFIICTALTIYIFKSVQIAAITFGILGLCVLWAVGLMAVLGVPINSTTGLSFGLIPVITMEIVIHMVIRYQQFHVYIHDKIAAIREVVRFLARPVFICILTTAVGFGTCMVSSIPMVFQLGLIMFIGVMISYLLAMILCPAVIVTLKSLDAPPPSVAAPDWMARILEMNERLILHHHRLIVGIGIVVTAFLFAGTPLVHSDPQILRWLKADAPEVKDIRFVETNLTPVSSLEIVLEGNDAVFKKAEVWQKVQKFQDRVRQLPYVTGVDSYLPLLEYLNRLIQGPGGTDKNLFSDNKLVPQLLHLMSFSEEGRRIGQRFLDDGFDRLHMSVRFQNSPEISILDVIEQVRSTAESAMKGAARVVVTGEIAVVASQASDLIRSEFEAMFLAFFIITGLMMIQMRSAVLGLIALVPNIPAVGVVFGMMGWLGISLDSVTVFAATVAIGLAVDNTVQYMNQLKREMKLNPDLGIEECVIRSYRLAAKPMASWTTVTLFGFLALVVSPFKPVVFFGVLGCASLAMGLFGDLLFMQSLILSSSTIRNAIKKRMESGAAA
jgi:uncharacterized protein